jgi:hypothetical protein
MDRRSAQSMADELNRGRARTKKTSQGYMALCPNHADKNPSLSIRETESGRILLKCFATTCTDQRQVYDAVERELRLDPGALGGPGDGYVPVIAQDKVKNVRPAFEAIVPVPDDAPPIARKAKSKKMGKPTTIWTYRNEHGRAMGHVARYDIPATDSAPSDKVIWPWTFGIREGKREWCVGAMPEPRVPFHLDLIAKNPATPILWHEGEKAADAGEVLFPNWIQTTTVGGGSAPHLTDFSHFAGRLVIICPDNDAAGCEYLALVAIELLKVGANVKVLRFPTAYTPVDGVLTKKPYVMGEGDDMADHLKNGWTTELIREAVSLSGIPLTWNLEEWELEETSQ